MYCLWPLPHLLLVSTTLVVFMCTTLVLFMCTTLVVFVCTTLVVFMCRTIVLVCTIRIYVETVPGGEENPWTTASHWRLEQIFPGSFHI